MAHAQKTDFVFRLNAQVHLSRRGRQFSRLLAAEVWASALLMLDTPCSEVVWRVLATHSIRQFPLHFPSRASPYAITFRTQYTARQSLPELQRNLLPQCTHVSYFYSYANFYQTIQCHRSEDSIRHSQHRQDSQFPVTNLWRAQKSAEFEREIILSLSLHSRTSFL